MAESFLKSLKWMIVSWSVVVGTMALIISEQTNSIKPTILCVLGYGMAYIMMAFWKTLRGKILFMSISVFLALTVLANYLTYIIAFLFGIALIIHPGISWALVMLFPGIPMMMYVFRRYD